MGKSLKAKAVSTRVFSEDYERVKKKILDPQGQAIHQWSKMFFVVSLFSLFLDPVFFYLPGAREEACIVVRMPLQITLTVIRSVADVFYFIHILIQFRTAYVAPSSRVLGRGELVIDTKKIALRYLTNGAFFIDLIAALPLPQVLIWAVIPNLRGSTTIYTKDVLRFVVTFQYVPRLFLVYPLSSQIVKATGIVLQTALAGAAYNVMLFMLASHILGAGWYLQTINRLELCWISACNLEMPTCEYGFFDCQSIDDPIRNNWFPSTNVTNQCGPTSTFFQFGIFAEALSVNITAPKFLNKFLYSFWWGLKNLSTFSQNLTPSTYIGEGLYTIVMGVLGLILLSLLIGNMLRYLESTTVHLEEWRIKKTDAEQWMHYRQLPPEQRQSVRKYDQYKWVATQGVHEEALLKDLPMDLRREVNRHLCLDLVRRVPLFDQLDEPTLDAIFERLKPGLLTKGTFQVREGDPVYEMVFIIRGHLDSYTTNGGRAGFFNSCRIGPGDFCGEELLTWALHPFPSIILPSSTRTVKAISEVEAFVLVAEDLKFVASQFRRLHSKQLRHKFRFYSNQWRTWAACYIQEAWHRFKKLKDEAELEARENPMATEPELVSLPGSGSTVSSGRLAASNRWGISQRFGSDSGRIVISMQKPEEPDFSVYEE